MLVVAVCEGGVVAAGDDPCRFLFPSIDPGELVRDGDNYIEEPKV